MLVTQEQDLVRAPIVSEEQTVFTMQTLIAATLALAVDSPTLTRPDSARIAAVRDAVRTVDRYQDKYDDEIRVDAFWGDVLKVRIYYGLNKDPVPPPFVEYVTPDNVLHGSFAEALSALEHEPVDDKEALELAVLIVNDAARDATVLVSEQDLAQVPATLRRRKRVKTPSVRTESDGYRVVLYTWQTAQQHSFSSRGREEQLSRHMVTIAGHTYRLESTTLHSGDGLMPAER